MDPLSVIAILTFIKDVVEQVRALKDTIDKVSDNDEKCRNLIAGILKSLEVLQEYCDTGSLEESRKTLQLRTDIVSYTVNLKFAISKCKKLVPPDRSGARATIGAWWNRDKIASELVAIQTDLTSCHQLFIAAGCIRIEKAVSDERVEINHKLDHLDGRLQTLFDSLAKRPEDAKNLLRLDNMNHKQMKTALRESTALIRDKPSAVQKQYLRVKIGALEEALNKTPLGTRDIYPAFVVAKSPSSNTHYPNTGMPSEDAGDAVLDTLDLLQTLRTGAREMPRSELAHRLNILSTGLYDIGLFDDSCAISRQAVRIYRNLTLSRPDFKPKLAVALNNLSIHLDGSKHNAPAEALDLLSEAIQICRHLVGGGQSVFNSDLATLLINSATRLGQLKRYPDAADAAMEALDILVHDHRNTFTPDLAVSLNAVGTTLRDMKQYEDALLVAERAVKIFRTLEAHGSHQFQPAFAAALSAYSRSLCDYGKHGDALEAVKEAVNVRRTLAHRRPEVYARPHVLSLWDLFDLHRLTGHHQEACRTAKNASEVYRNLIQDGFVDLKPDFASLLLATANCSLDLNLPNDALAAIVEAVDLYAQLASTADKYRSSQADCLDIAHSCYTRLGSHHKAYQAACKAIRIRQGLDLGQSERANPLLGSSVTNSANSLLKLERFSDARKELTYAVSIYRTLAVRNPETHRPNLAYSLNNLSSCLRKLKEDDEALEAAEEAVKIYRKLASNSSDNIHLERLATCLYNLAHCHSVLQGYTAGLQSAEDAVRIYSRLCATGSRLRPRLEQSQRYYNELKENISHKSRSYRK